jgi:hypothetical protein
VRGKLYPRTCLQKDSLTFGCFGQILENLYKITEKLEKCKTNFVGFLLSRPTSFAKHVYTFEL